MMTLIVESIWTKFEQKGSFLNMAEGGVAPIECDVMLIQFECSIKILARYEAEPSNEGRFLADTPQTPGKYSTPKFTRFCPF